MRLYSLRRATLRAIVLPVLAAMIAVTASAVWLTHEAIGEVRDEQMRQEAALLMLLAKHEAAEGESLGQIGRVDPNEPHDSFGERTRFRIWLGGKVVAESHADPQAPAKPPPVGFSMRGSPARWRTFALRDRELPITVEVSEAISIRTAMVRQIALSLGIPLVLLALAVGVIAHLQVAAAFRPMVRMSADVDARSPDDVSPLKGHEIPMEIAALFDAFNRLLARFGAAIERERQFSDNAAHELRTPLAALKTRAQIVVRDLMENPAQRESAAKLVAAADRATGVIDHLLLLNRVGAGSGSFVEVDFSKVVEDVARESAPMAIDKDQQFGADVEPSIVVRGHAEALAILVRNLIDNAIRYTPRRGVVDVSLRRTAADEAVLRVEDSGPGVPQASLDSVFDRFVRLSGDEPGSGLGLSIVRTIAERHGGRVELVNRQPHGLAVVFKMGVDRPVPAGAGRIA